MQFVVHIVSRENDVDMMSCLVFAIPSLCGVSIPHTSPYSVFADGVVHDPYTMDVHRQIRFSHLPDYTMCADCLDLLDLHKLATLNI